MIDYVEMTVDIAAAYVSNNSVPLAELPDLLRSLHTALSDLGGTPTQTIVEAEVEKPTAAQIRKSVMQDGIVSFLDGKTYKTMKRHLTGHGLDPYSYRARFGLPTDYPMVAPSYAAMRSDLAKSIGLGRVAPREDDVQPSVKGRKKAA